MNEITYPTRQEAQNLAIYLEKFLEDGWGANPDFLRNVLLSYANIARLAFLCREISVSGEE